jgi:hypothetical protein
MKRRTPARKAASMKRFDRGFTVAWEEERVIGSVEVARMTTSWFLKATVSSSVLRASETVIVGTSAG